MQHTVTALIEWSVLNHMNINTKKTMEMLMGPNDKETRTLMISSYRLLGVVIDSILKWVISVLSRYS